MLHHANVDRLSALWMAVHFNATHQSESYATNGLYGTASGENITAGSPLKPFYQANGRTFHTGLSVASLDTFGYTYPELEELGRDQDQGRKAVVSRINDLYGSANDGTGSAGEEWFVEVSVNRSELVLPCNIGVYVGRNFAGRVALLGMPKQGLAHSEISLQRAIKSLGLNMTDHAAVRKILREKLRVEMKEVRHKVAP